MVSIRACRARDLGSSPSRGAVIIMVVTLKLDKGTAEKLIEWMNIKSDQSRNLTGKELTLELNDKDVLIELHEKENLIEIADFNGSFGVWFELTNEKIEKLKEILRNMGP
jgi:hypothetical protein